MGFLYFKGLCYFSWKFYSHLFPSFRSYVQEITFTRVNHLLPCTSLLFIVVTLGANVWEMIHLVLFLNNNVQCQVSGFFFNLEVQFHISIEAAIGECRLKNSP